MSQGVAPSLLNADVQTQVAPRQSVVFVAPVQPSVDQLQVSLVLPLEQRHSFLETDVETELIDAESWSPLHFAARDRDEQTPATEKVPNSPLALVQPQRIAPIETQLAAVQSQSILSVATQQKEMLAQEQAARYEEQIPLIRVRIGRVVVRVTPPLTPPATVKPAPRPALSLNDYLVQRRKGVQ